MCDGRCRDLHTDAGHCGSCGHSCDQAQGQVCSAGECQLCPTGTTKTGETCTSAWPVGFLDVVDSSHAAGWACDPDDFSAPIIIHFYIDGVLIGGTLADIPAEPGVADACGGYNAHRFDYAFPPIIRDGQPHWVDVYAIDYALLNQNPLLGEVLVCPVGTTESGGSCTSAWPFGVVDVVDASHAAGWACDPDDFSAPIAIHIYIDGALIDSIVANIPAGSGVADACGGYNAHRFDYALPAIMRDGQPHWVDVYAIDYVGANQNPLLGEVLVCPDGSTRC